jgi:hypothetical protein
MFDYNNKYNNLELAWQKCLCEQTMLDDETIIGKDSFDRTYTVAQCIQYIQYGGAIAYLKNGFISFRENTTRRIRLTKDEKNILRQKITQAVEDNKGKMRLWVWDATDSNKHTKIFTL